MRGRGTRCFVIRVYMYAFSVVFLNITVANTPREDHRVEPKRSIPRFLINTFPCTVMKASSEESARAQTRRLLPAAAGNAVVFERG